VLIVLLVAFSGVPAFIPDPRTPADYAKRTIVILVVLLALMGFGAVSGKTLGDFLRNVNG
jgi:hypothetical protein